MKKEYAYSLNGERFFILDSVDIKDIVEEIIETGELEDKFKEDGFALVDVGEIMYYNDSGSDCYETILDYFYERAYDEGGEWADSYMNTNHIPNEAREYLESELDRIWEKFKDMAGESSPFFNIHEYDTYKIFPNGGYEKVGDPLC